VETSPGVITLDGFMELDVLEGSACVDLFSPTYVTSFLPPSSESDCCRDSCEELLKKIGRKLLKHGLGQMQRLKKSTGLFFCFPGCL
jgi:hypothetical protein